MQTVEKLKVMKLNGMIKGYEQQLSTPNLLSTSFEERFGLLVDKEESDRHDRKFTGRMRTAKLREKACLEDLDLRGKRGLDRQQILALSNCDWVTRSQNILITGATGVGKTYLACALVHKACFMGYTGKYVRLSRLLLDLAVGRAAGRYINLIKYLAKIDVLLIDDWAMVPLTAEQRQDAFEVIEERHKKRPTILTSQLPIDKWHLQIGEPTIADAILDRLVHGAHKINLTGGSMRLEESNLTKPSAAH